jgi:hypothetical protein
VHCWQLPAGVDVLLAADQRDEGTALAEEMQTIAGSFGCPSVQAGSTTPPLWSLSSVAIRLPLCRCPNTI